MSKMSKIRQSLAEGRPSFGVNQVYSSPLQAEHLAGLGFDFIMLDTQHAMSPSEVRALVQVVDAAGTDTLVRVGRADEFMIGQALDMGATGVIVPLVSTPQEAEIAAAATRYPPMGRRSYGQLRNARATDVANADVLCIIQIEDVRGMENLDKIAGTPGIDGIYVGPVDLALSMGHSIPNYYKDFQIPKDVEDAIDEIIAACKRHNIIPSIPAFSYEHAEEMLRKGARFMTLGADIDFVLSGAARDLEKARAWTEAFTISPERKDKA